MKSSYKSMQGASKSTGKSLDFKAFFVILNKKMTRLLGYSESNIDEIIFLSQKNAI